MSKPMKILVIGSEEYEVVDAASRTRLDAHDTAIAGKVNTSDLNAEVTAAVEDYLEENPPTTSPLVGTTSALTPSDVETAVLAGRDVVITHSTTFNNLPINLEFTEFNVAVDSAYSGLALHAIVANTIIKYDGIIILFALVGTIAVNGSSVNTWSLNQEMLASQGNVDNLENSIQQELYTKEDSNNKVVILSASSTDATYPSAKAVYDAIQAITSANVSPVKNKKVVCFGDSLFGMYRGTDSAPYYVAQECGADVINVGFGGCRMSVHPSNGYAQFSMWALAKAVAEQDFTAQDTYASSGSDYFESQLNVLENIDFSTVDYAVIHYGTNDFQGNVPLDDATGSTDYNTICGALRYSLEKLMTAYPQMQILVSLPVFRYWTDNGTTIYSDEKTNSNGITLPEVCMALNNVCYDYGVPVIDGYRGLSVNSHNAATYYTDGTHHNLAGRERFGRYIGKNIIHPIPAQYIAHEKESSYTNLLIDAGYKTGYRINSSGAESADSGFCMSGYIPVNYLDKVYLKNIDYNSAASNASSQRICFYDSSKNFITGCVSGANATSQLGKVYDSNNDLIEFQVANVGSNSAANAKYFRICAPTINDNSIITVNEEIV